MPTIYQKEFRGIVQELKIIIAKALNLKTIFAYERAFDTTHEASVVKCGAKTISIQILDTVEIHYHKNTTSEQYYLYFYKREV